VRYRNRDVYKWLKMNGDGIRKSIARSEQFMGHSSILVMQYPINRQADQEKLAPFVSPYWGLSRIQKMEKLQST